MRRVCSILLSFFLVLGCELLSANGWEHGAIPFDALLRALQFDVVETRIRAARSLGVRRQPEAVAPLITRLEQEDNERVREAIYQALGNLKVPKAEKALIKCLSEGREVDKLRALCAQSLAFHTTDTALESLLSASRDSSDIVKYRALDMLGFFNDSRAVKRLADSLKHQDSELRQRALRAVAQTGAREAAPILLDALESATDDVTRLTIVTGLGKSGAVEAVPVLNRIKAETNHPVLQTAAVIALGSIQHANRTQALADFLKDPLPAVRLVSLKALRELADPSASTAILNLAQANAIKLEKLNWADTSAEPLHVLALLSEQILALETLTELDPVAAINVLLSAAQLKDVSIESNSDAELAVAVYRLKRVVLYGLGYTASQDAHALLASKFGIGHDDFRLRAVATRSLGVLGKTGATETLLPVLRDPTAEVRWTAAQVLGLLGDDSAVHELISTLKDSDARVRTQAAAALGYLKASQARPLLTELLNDDTEAVQQAARLALDLLN